MQINPVSIEIIFQAYVWCALWSSSDDDGPLSDLYSIDDIDPATLEKMREDVTDFVQANTGLILQLIQVYPSVWWSDIGHDFWLTRNGHGAGFWDRGHGVLGDKLSDAAKVYRSVDLYVGDNGMIYTI